MFRAIFFMFVILFLPTYLRANQIPLLPNPESKTLSTSVLTPCVASHFKLIPELLTHYNQQTELPNEVVVSLSECQKVESAEIESLEQFSWNFSLKIVKSTEKLSAGQNRNIALA